MSLLWLTHYLPHRKYSINIYWENEWVNQSRNVHGSLPTIARCQISDFTETTKMMTTQKQQHCLAWRLLFRFPLLPIASTWPWSAWFDRNAHKLRDYFRATNPIMAGAWHRDGECLPVNLTEWADLEGIFPKAPNTWNWTSYKKNEDLSHTRKQREMPKCFK